jgi:bifunctional non-homologous end joining protein LigD
VGKLKRYREKRRFAETPEPSGPAAEAPEGPQAEAEPEPPEELPRFVVQEHHATRLHWDLRLERDGVLVSWAVPRGIPPDPKRNHLAVHVEDHPMEYIDFAGEIPRGNYGAGRVSIWDRGTYETHKWRLDEPKGEVMVTLRGERVRGRYVLFQTNGKDWMIHRMDPPQDPEREEMPDSVVPMTAHLADRLPARQDAYGFEFKWDGIRAIVFSHGGTLKVQSRNLEDVTRRYPELRALSEALGSHEVVLDGEIVALGPKGIPSFAQLQQRMGLNSDTEIKRKAKEVPVVYMLFDLLYLDGRSLLGLPYRERRRLLDGLALAGPNWQTPEYQAGEGEAMLDASTRTGLEGIMAKRLDSVYVPGKRTDAWLKVKHHLRQELLIGGWFDGEGRRKGHLGAVAVGYWEDGKLVYAGKVGTGFNEKTLDDLARRLAPLARKTSPFDRGSPPKGAHFVEPELVAEFEFAEWTPGGQLRAGSFKGLRQDKDPREVVRERPL